MGRLANIGRATEGVGGVQGTAHFQGLLLCDSGAFTIGGRRDDPPPSRSRLEMNESCKMPRKVILDCDPGIDDAIALCMALFDPRLEVVAVTATAGNVDAHQASRNVQTILEMLDPPRWPRLGVCRDDGVGACDAGDLNGADGLGNLGVQISELHHLHPAEKVIGDEVRNYPGEVTVVSLGPLTNIARAINLDPDLTTMIHQVVIAGGSIAGIGNATPSAEFNIHCDPDSARQVLRSPMTKTVVPLDLTSEIVFSLDFMDRLPGDGSRAGEFLRRVLPYLYRSYRQNLGLEAIHLHSAVALLFCLQSELFETREMAVDVEVSGELTTGMTVFDRRPRATWRNNTDVATSAQSSDVCEAIMRGLRFAAQETT